LITDTIEYCSRNIPKYYPVSVCGYHIRESGANPVQEIAYAFSIAKAYIERVLARGIDANDFIARISFNFDIHGNFFEQIAKFRAARRLWAKIIKDEFGATNPKAMMMKMIAGGGGGGLTIEQPENNIVRGAYYALVSALSGTQTMALCSYDEAYTIPSEKAALISLRTMQILIEEMGLCDTADPMGGSYYVEALTDQLEEKIVDCMNQVEKRGGIVSAISKGEIQREVAKQAYLYEKMIQSGELVKVGVNKYRIEEEERTIKMHEHDPTLVKQQIKTLNQIKKTRDNKKVKKSLEKLHAMAQTDENLMPYIIDCVRAYATVGEITTVLKEVFGKFKEPVGI
jgi:methylmalonyl-CoA mutase N-terminal domain/subunit